MSDELTVEGKASRGYPKLKAPGFGRVVVGGETWERDLYIRADGRVEKRRKKLAKEAYGTSHVIGPAELAKVCKGGPETLVIARGYNGAAHLAPEGETWLQEQGIAVVILPTPAAAEHYNSLPGRKAILVHVTC